MKNSKRLLSFFTIIFALTGCGNTISSSSPISSSTSSNNANSSSSALISSSTSSSSEYVRFESEYINVTNPTLLGSGISGSASGVNLVLQDANASNGWFIGYSHRTGFAVSYTITSNQASTAKMKVGFGNELGVGMKMNTSTLAISINGTNLNYTEFTVKVSGWNSYDISSTLSLVKGENTIVMTVGENEYCNGGTGGPMFDYIDLKSASTLTWNPITSNIEE